MTPEWKKAEAERQAKRNLNTNPIRKYVRLILTFEDRHKTHQTISSFDLVVNSLHCVV